MSDTIDFDPESLTLEELCDFEDATGEVASDVFGSGKMSAKALVGIVWIVKRRADPEYTFAAAKALRIGDIVGLVGNGD